MSGSYAYVVAFGSNALVVVDVSNPASPVIRGSVVSSSLMNGVSDPDLRAWLASGTALASASSIVLAPAAPPPADALSALTRSLTRSRVLCTQPQGLAMSGSYAYVVGEYSNSLVVIDVSNPASPVIRGSVVSSSLMSQAYDVAVSGSYAYVAGLNSDSLVVVDVSNPLSPVIRGSVISSSLLDGVREARSCGRGCFQAPHLHPHRPSCLHPRRHRLPMLSRALTRSLACCARRL